MVEFVPLLDYQEYHPQLAVSDRFQVVGDHRSVSSDRNLLEFSDLLASNMVLNTFL